MANVSLVKAETRYATIKKALEFVKDDVRKSLSGKKRIVIKPNMVSPYVPLCSTHVDVTRATIDFLREYTSSKMVIAEGSAFDTKTGFQNYGYMSLSKEYGIELIDLNNDDSVDMKVYDRDFKEITVHIAKTMVDADYRVSLAPMKTHDCLIVTLSLKNVVVGSAQDDKKMLHQGYPAMNLNMYKIIQRIPPSLAVIDGWIGMEGDGPLDGTPVEMGIALASTDFVAADTAATYLMGFDPNEVGYLNYVKGRLGVGDLNKINIVGEELVPLRRKFKPHHRYNEQRMWQIPPAKLAKLL